VGINIKIDSICKLKYFILPLDVHSILWWPMSAVLKLILK